MKERGSPSQTCAMKELRVHTHIIGVLVAYYTRKMWNVIKHSVSSDNSVVVTREEGGGEWTKRVKGADKW